MDYPIGGRRRPQASSVYRHTILWAAGADSLACLCDERLESLTGNYQLLQSIHSDSQTWGQKEMANWNT